MDELAALGIAQALYNAVKDEVSTARAGNVRDAANRRLREAFDATGGAVRSMDLVVNGETVGALTAGKTEGVHVTDADALQEWLDAHGYVHVRAAFDYDRMTDAERAELEAWAARRWPHLVREVEEVDGSWQDRVGHVGRDVVDADGEVVPGVEWAVECGTVRVTGCQMWPDPRKRSSKYAPVGEVLARAGIDAGQAIRMIGGTNG